MDKTFFQLIRVSLGLDLCLNKTPSTDEWIILYEMSVKQSLLGECFAGVQKLIVQKQHPSESLYLKWMGMAAKIQQRNEFLNNKMSSVLFYYRNKGIPCTLLKGQGIASLYGGLSKIR